MKKLLCTLFIIFALSGCYEDGETIIIDAGSGDVLCSDYCHEKYSVWTAYDACMTACLEKNVYCDNGCE